MAENEKTGGELTTEDASPAVLDELAEEAEREEREQARYATLGEFGPPPGPYDGTVPYASSEGDEPEGGFAPGVQITRHPGFSHAGPRAPMTCALCRDEDAAAEWNRAETRQDGEMVSMIADLVQHEHAKPVYEQCPDKGTCHHGCGPDGPCFRVLHAGPLSGRYDGDVWPQEIRAAHGQRAHDAASLPKRIPGRVPVLSVDLSGDYDVAVFRLRSGDVIHAYVDPMDGTLIVENRVSNLAVFPVSPNRAKVM